VACLNHYCCLFYQVIVTYQGIDSSTCQTSKKLFVTELAETSSSSSVCCSAGSSLKESAGICSYPGYLNAPPPPKINDLTVSDQHELNHFQQQVENHLAKFSPEHSEGCETSCSTDVKQLGELLCMYVSM
jgi:hypothetical protein